MLDRKASRFNIAVPATSGDDVLLFNTATRALLRVDPETFEPARSLFHDGVRGLPRDLAAPVPAELDDDLIEALVAGGFLVAADVDEVAVLRGAFEQARATRDLVFTIGLTMACNFACPYCFEEHRPEHLTPESARAVGDFIIERMAGADSVFVNWFGGEPLLNVDVLVDLSTRLRDEAARRGVRYESMAISNGALLTRPVAERLSAAGVDRVQITIDGPPDIHDARRPFKGGQPSFARILANLKESAGAIAMLVRVNVDRDNHPRVGELVRILADEGLLDGAIERVYAGKLTSYTEQVQMVGETFAQRDIVHLDAPIRDELAALGLPPPPRPTTLADRTERGGCQATRNDSYVIGPRGHLFKCDLGIHDVREAVGVVPGSEAAMVTPPKARGRHLPVVGQAVGSLAHDWSAYNPFDNAKCSGCQFVPVCKGGCPKRVLEQETDFMQQTCDYWDQHIVSMIQQLDG